MDNIKNIVTGGIITLVIGGTAYNFSQEDVVNNLAEDTGMTQEEATQYVDSIPEEDFATWEEIGADFKKDSDDTRKMIAEIDCDNYEYEWETITLTCAKAKTELEEILQIESSLELAYKKLDTDSATSEDIQKVMTYLDKLNESYKTEAILTLYDSKYIVEMTKTNAYNRSVLKTALESKDSL
jgi:hypothetical protein